MDAPIPPEEGLMASMGMLGWLVPLLTAAGGWASALFLMARRVGSFESSITSLRQDFDDHLVEAERRVTTYDQRISDLQREHSELKASLAALPGAIMDRMNDGPLDKIQSTIREMRQSVENSIRDVRTRVEQISDRDRANANSTPRRREPN